MKTFLRKPLLILSAALVAVSLSACGGGGDEDPDFDGPEWEGGCPDPVSMRGEIDAALAAGFPPPPFDEFCPDEYARMKQLK